jgi:hypothetical protein
MARPELLSKQMPARFRPSATGVVWTTVPLNFRPIPSSITRNSTASSFWSGKSDMILIPPELISAVLAKARRLAWLYSTDFSTLNRGLLLRSLLISTIRGFRLSFLCKRARPRWALLFKNDKSLIEKSEERHLPEWVLSRGIEIRPPSNPCAK